MNNELKKQHHYDGDYYQMKTEKRSNYMVGVMKVIIAFGVSVFVSKYALKFASFIYQIFEK